MEYKSFHNHLRQLEEFGFNINWSVIKIGYFGNEFISPLLTVHDICSFVIKQLEFADSVEFNNDLAIQLLCAENDEYEFKEILNQLSKNEKVCMEMQLQKWIVLLLFKQLQNLSEDYTEGLIQLTEFWISIGLPDNCPHIIQGSNNSLSPNEYYTQAMYTALKKRNQQWLNNEISHIIATENNKSYLFNGNNR